MDRRALLFLFVIANLVNYIDRYVLASVLQPLGLDLQLDDAQLGRLASMFLVIYMIAAPIFGIAAEKISRTKLVGFGIALWSVATFGCGLARTYEELLFARSLVGIGEAAYATLGPAILSDLYAERERTRAFTWFYLAIPVGTALGYTLGGAVAEASGWRSAFYLAGFPGLFLALMLYRLPDPQRGALDTQADTTAKDSYFKKVRAIVQNRVWVATTICATGYTFALGALAHWAPTFLVRKYGITVGHAGTAFGAIAILTGLFGTLIGGELTARLQARWNNAGLWISGLTLLAGVPLLLLTLRAPTVEASYVLWTISLLLLFVNTSPVNATNVSCLPASTRATGVAVCLTFSHLFGDAISPAIVGWHSTQLSAAGTASGASLATALEFTLPAIIVAAIALWWARRNESSKNESAVEVAAI